MVKSHSEASSQRNGPGMDEERHARILELCTEGDALVEREELATAVLRFREACALIPRPIVEHDVAPRVLTSLAETCFKMRRYSEAKHSLQVALMSLGGFGPPHLHLRMGQCEMELDHLERATDELSLALKGGGEQLFANEDPKYLQFLRSRPAPPKKG